MKFRLPLSALSVCATLVMGAAHVAADEAKPPVQQVKIGVLTDMTGPYSDLVGPGAVLAAQMAVEDFTAAENPSFPIAVLSGDHHLKPDIAVSIARKWFDEDGVDVVTDVTGSSITLAVSKLGAQKNKIVLATSSGQNSISRADCQPTTFQWTDNTRAVSGSTARVVAEAGGKSWFFLTADYAGGRSMVEDATAMITAAGGKVVGGVNLPIGTMDFSSALLQAQASGAEVVGFANGGGDFTTSLKQATEFGITPSQKLAGMSVFVTDIDAVGLSKAQGLTVTEPFYWDTNDETRAWSTRFYKVRHKMPTTAQAGLYSGVLHYLKAVKAANTTETSAVIAKMREIPVNDMFTKNAHLRADNLLIRDMYVFQVKTPAESKYPWDFYTLKHTIKGEEAFQPLDRQSCPFLREAKP